MSESVIQEKEVPKKHKLMSLLFVLLVLGLVIYLAFSNSDLKDAAGALKSLDPLWAAVALLCGLMYMAMDGFGLYIFFRRQGYRIPMGTALHMSLINLFYANITPGSAGGQPMVVFQLNKRGIPSGVATGGVVVRFFFNQLAVVVLTAVLYLTNRGFFYEHLHSVNGLVLVGFLVNFATIPIVLLATYKMPVMERFVNWILRLFRRWIKNPEKVQSGVHTVLTAYQKSMLMMGRHPMNLLRQFLVSCIQMLFLVGVVPCVYFALGQTGTTIPQLLMVALMLFVSASYTPLPGASGAQEGGFLLYFRHIFTDGTVSIALLIWRFFTYYLFLFLGTGDTIITALRKKRAARIETEPVSEDAT